MLGISADTPEKQKKFKARYKLPYPLLADTEKKVCQAFGVLKEKTMFGRKSFGIERTTFVINPEGQIARIFPKVKILGHPEQVLAAIKDAVVSR